MQNRTRDLMSGVAGKPTTTTASFRSRHWRENAEPRIHQLTCSFSYENFDIRLAWHLCRIIQHNRNHRAVRIAEHLLYEPQQPTKEKRNNQRHLASHSLQARTEKIWVLPQLFDLLLAFSSAILSHDHAESEIGLNRTTRSHCAGINRSWRAPAQVANDFRAGGNVPSNRAERLCKCAHHDVNVVRTDAGVLQNAPTSSSESANRVSLIYIDIRLIPDQTELFQQTSKEPTALAHRLQTATISFRLHISPSML